MTEIFSYKRLKWERAWLKVKLCLKYGVRRGTKKYQKIMNAEIDFKYAMAICIPFLLDGLSTEYPIAP